MKHRLYTSIFLACLLAFLYAAPTQAHPGRTANDGCHYCRTNCDSWGVAWNARHCHGGTISTPPPSTESNTGYVPDRALARVVSVTDGDTIKADISGTTYAVRLIGIDTPETVHPTKPVECFGKEASAYLTSLVNGQLVTLERDSIGDNEDKYDRLLRYIELNGEDINGKMVKDGYAYAYTTYPFERSDQYVSYQTEARNNKVGLWASGVCGNDIDATVALATSEVEGTTTTTTPILEQPETTQTKPQETTAINQTAAPVSSDDSGDYGGGFLTGLIVAGIAAWIGRAIKKRKKKASLTEPQ